MYAQFFGNYLLSHGVVTREQLLETMHRKSSTKIKLGTLAIHAGYMTANEVDRIVILQTHEDKRFGELAIHEGYLTEAEVTKLLAEQKPDFLLLGQALVDEGLINNQQLQELIIDYQSENELDDYSYSEEDQDAIRHIMRTFSFSPSVRSQSMKSLFSSFCSIISIGLSEMISHWFLRAVARNTRPTTAYHRK